MSNQAQSVRQTPWGHADHVQWIADGIAHVFTSSHGGFYVSSERLDALPVPFRKFVPFAKLPNWFEEDCDWAVVTLAFPDLFPQDTLRAAVQTVLGMRPEYFGPVRQWLESANGVELRARVADTDSIGAQGMEDVCGING